MRIAPEPGVGRPAWKILLTPNIKWYILKWVSCLVCELFPNKTINCEKFSGQAGLCSGPSLRQQVG